MTKQIARYAVAAVTLVAGIFWFAYLASQPTPSYTMSFRQWLAAVGLLFVSLLLLIAPIVALRHPRAASLILLLPVPFLVLWCCLAMPWPLTQFSFEGATTNSVTLMTMLSLFILPGAYWLFLSKTDNKSVSTPVVRTTTKVITVTVIVISVVCVTIGMDIYSRNIGECHYEMHPFAKQLFPRQAVFTAREIGSGLLWPSRSVANQSPGLPKKYWALVSVQKPFWGLPWWDRKIALLTVTTNADLLFEPGENYFIDGRHESGVLTRFLPIYSIFCTRTNRLKDAEIDMRVLRDGSPHDGIRILGRTVKVVSRNLEPVAGIPIVISGPSGKTNVTSDQNGVFDISGLPPGRYNIGRQTEKGGVVWEQPSCMSEVRDEPTRTGDIRDCTIFVR